MEILSKHGRMMVWWKICHDKCFKPLCFLGDAMIESSEERRKLVLQERFFPMIPMKMPSHGPNVDFSWKLIWKRRNMAGSMLIYWRVSCYISHMIFNSIFICIPWFFDSKHVENKFVDETLGISPGIMENPKKHWPSHHPIIPDRSFYPMINHLGMCIFCVVYHLGYHCGEISGRPFFMVYNPPLSWVMT
jgi:hypothetical protein